MKKLFTLLLGVALFSVAAMAQDRRYQNDMGYNNPYQSRVYNNQGWNRDGYDFDHGRRGNFEDRGEFFGRHRHRDWYERHYYRHRRGLFFRMFIGRRDRF